MSMCYEAESQNYSIKKLQRKPCLKVLLLLPAGSAIIILPLCYSLPKLSVSLFAFRSKYLTHNQ